jgi:FixJ family two-component response regulator
MNESTLAEARLASNTSTQAAGVFSPMDVTGDYTAQNLSAGQRDVMKLIARALSNKEIASILNLAEGTVKILTAKECLQSAEACLALAHKTKELGTRAAVLEFAYEFRTVAKRLERDERKLMMRAASDVCRNMAYNSPTRR